MKASFEQLELLLLAKFIADLEMTEIRLCEYEGAASMQKLKELRELIQKLKARLQWRHFWLGLWNLSFCGKCKSSEEEVDNEDLFGM